MTDGRTDGGDCNIPDAFLKKRGDNKSSENDQLTGDFQSFSFSFFLKNIFRVYRNSKTSNRKFYFFPTFPKITAGGFLNQLIKKIWLFSSNYKTKK